MKKTLLAATMLSLATMGWAQDSFTNALDAQVGDNTYEVSAADSVFWKYTATEDVAITVAGLNSAYDNTAVYVNQDGTVPTASSNALKGAQEGKTNTYPLLKGQTAYFMAYNEGTVGFTLSTTTMPGIGHGLSEDDPLTLVLDQKQYLGNAFATGYSNYYTYATYTATEDGVLKIATKSYVSSCTANGTSYSAEYANNYYNIQIPVTAETEYKISFYGYSPMVLTATISHPTAGSVDLPFELTEGSNTVPAAYGTYYYTYTPAKKGYFTITSDETLAGGNVTVYSSKSQMNYNSAAATSATGSFDVRTEVKYVQGYTYYVKVNKVESTDADQTFTFAMEDYKEGEQESNPISLDLPSEDVTVPSATGTYYYVVDVPANTNKFLIVKAKGTLSGSTMLYIYPQGSSYYYGKSTSEGYLRYDVSATEAKSYIIRWTSNETSPVVFDVTTEDIVQGSIITNPLIAQLGENTFVGNGTQYYKYTATKSGKLSVTVDTDNEVTFPRGTGDWDGNYDATLSGATYSISAEAGTDYLFAITNAVTGNTFTVAEGDFAQGEAQSNPFWVTDGVYNVDPTNYSNVWIAYKATEAGKLNIACNAEYNPNSYIEYGKATDEYFNALMNYKQEGGDYVTVYEGSTKVAVDDVVYVHLQLASATDGITVTFTLAEPQAGESAENPIVLELNKPVTIPVPSYSEPVWVKINANGKDDVKVKASDYVGGTWYESADALNDELAPDATFQGDYDEDNNYVYFFTATGVQKGACYLMFYRAWEEVTLTLISGSDETTDGIESVNAAKTGAVQVYTINGQKVANTTEGLKAGLYIVSQNGKTQKVIVK